MISFRSLSRFVCRSLTSIFSPTHTKTKARRTQPQTKRIQRPTPLKGTEHNYTNTVFLVGTCSTTESRMASPTEESPLATFLANLRREVAAEADLESQENSVSTTNDDDDDDVQTTSTDLPQCAIVEDHARTHQRRLVNRRSTPRHHNTQGDVSPRYPRHHHHGGMIQRQLSPVSVSSVESSPEIFSTSSSPSSPSSSPRDSSKRLLLSQQHNTERATQLFVPPPLLVDSNFSRWEMPTYSSVVDRSPGELRKPRRGLDFVSESEVSSSNNNKNNNNNNKEEPSTAPSSSYGLFVPFTDSQDEQDDAAAVDDVRTSRWDAIVCVTKALSIVDGQQHHNNSHSHSHNNHHCCNTVRNTTAAPKMIPRKSSLVDLNDLMCDDSSASKE